MDIRKLIVKISYGLIATLVIVLVGLLVYQQKLIQQMSDGNGQSPPVAAIPDSPPKTSTTQSPPPEDGGSTEQLASEIDALKYHLEATEEELDMAREDLANERDKETEKASDLITMQKKMLENPSAKKMMRSTFENTLGETYGALFKELGLSDEKIQSFKTLLADYQMQTMEVSLDLMDQSLPEDERKKIMALLEDQKAELENQVSDLIGAKNYEIYDAYQERLTERQFAAAFFDSFGTDNGLSEEKEQELIDTMYAARKEVEAEYGIDSSDISQTFGDGDLDATEMMAQQMERMNSIFDRYIESARGVLSESQAKQFTAKMKEQQELMAMSAEMARSLMGGSDDTQ
jgi:hypothetical protein